MSEHRAPFHYGGPLGLGALVAVAGAAGVYLYTNNDPNIAAETSHSRSVVVATLPEKKEGSIDTQAELSTEKIGEAPAGQQTPAPPQNDGKEDAAGAKPKLAAPASQKRPRVQADKPVRVQAVPAQAKGAEVVFIVRIKGSDDIDQAARLFKKR